MIYIASILESTKITIHPLIEAVIALLDIQKINLLSKYSNFANVFYLILQ